MTDPAAPPYGNMIARVTVPVIIAAFVIQPDLVNMSPVERVILLTTITLGLLVLDAASHATGYLRVLLAAVAITPAFIAFTAFSLPAVQDEAANDRRCIAIQADMLSSMPLRSDGPDLFQALGCKPKGEGSVYAERDTKEDANVIIEQRARRAKLPYRDPYRGDGSGAALK